MAHSSATNVLVILLSLLLLSACGDRNNKNNNLSETGSDSSEAAIDPALDSLNRRIAEDPDNFQVYLDRAKYYSEKDNFNEAYRDISRAMEADSTQSAIYLLKGELHWLQQDVRAAYDSYKACLLAQPEDISCLLKKAAIDITLENYTVALEEINLALKKNEFLAEPYYLKGRLYKQSGDTTLAASSYQTAIERNPDYYDAYIEVGLLYAERKHDLAKEYYSTAIEIRPRSIEAWYNKAMFLQETGARQRSRYQEAFACYDSILSIDPSFSPAWFNKGFIHLEYLAEYAEGVDDFTTAVRLNPSYYQAFYNRGLCFESLGKKKEAEADYRKALSLKPDYTEAAKALNRALGQ
jgi:tetratricopeptide (TPR) repeat protein